jgi:hypothetical protein
MKKFVHFDNISIKVDNIIYFAHDGDGKTYLKVGSGNNWNTIDLKLPYEKVKKIIDECY